MLPSINLPKPSYSPRVLQNAGVLFYGRFKDDVLWVCKGRTTAMKFRALWDRWSKAAGEIFEVVASHVRYDTVAFLQCNVSFVGDRVVCSPKFKESNMGAPLCPSSCHPRAVHHS